MPGFLFNAFQRVVRALWGDLTKEELKKFGILSVAMMLVIGNYWMLRTTKNAVFGLFVGFRQWQPVAKMVSLLVMIFVVLAYSKLVDLFKRRKLIYAISSFYGVMFLILSYLISNPGVVSVSESSALYPFVSWIPGKFIGWFSYVLLESYGSMLIALFFSFVASVMTTGSAKKGYGMMFAVIQVGTVTGVSISILTVEKMGIPFIYFLGGIFILIAPMVIKFYLKTFPGDIEEAKESVASRKKKTGFWEGARLILTRPYIMGIFVVASFYEIISTIVEYQMNWLATSVYGDGTAAFAKFTGYQALGINMLAMFFALIGTSFFMRKFGLKFCLIAFPSMIGLVVFNSFLLKSVGTSNYFLMWILLAATVAIKGFNYALNKPTSEVMYIPTSKDVRFKSKGWIDMFGLRSTKGIGATVTKTFGYSFPILMIFGTVASFAVLIVWLFTARSVGNKFDQLQKDGSIVE